MLDVALDLLLLAVCLLLLVTFHVSGQVRAKFNLHFLLHFLFAALLLDLLVLGFFNFTLSNLALFLSVEGGRFEIGFEGVLRCGSCLREDHLADGALDRAVWLAVASWVELISDVLLNGVLSRSNLVSLMLGSIEKLGHYVILVLHRLVTLLLIAELLLLLTVGTSHLGQLKTLLQLFLFLYLFGMSELKLHLFAFLHIFLLGEVLHHLFSFSFSIDLR